MIENIRQPRQNVKKIKESNDLKKKMKESIYFLWEYTRSCDGTRTTLEREHVNETRKQRVSD
jgi:hypothetical protein